MMNTPKGGSHKSRQDLAQFAQAILQDPVLLEKLCDRIYDLLITEIRWQQDRHSRRF